MPAYTIKALSNQSSSPTFTLFLLLISSQGSCYSLPAIRCTSSNQSSIPVKNSSPNTKSKFSWPEESFPQTAVRTIKRMLPNHAPYTPNSIGSLSWQNLPQLHALHIIQKSESKVSLDLCKNVWNDVCFSLLSSKAKQPFSVGAQKMTILHLFIGFAY